MRSFSSSKRRRSSRARKTPRPSSARSRAARSRAPCERGRGRSPARSSRSRRASASRGAWKADRPAVDEQLPCVRPVDAADHLRERRLPGAVLADEAVDASRRRSARETSSSACTPPKRFEMPARLDEGARAGARPLVVERRGAATASSIAVLRLEVRLLPAPPSSAAGSSACRRRSSTGTFLPFPASIASCVALIAAGLLGQRVGREPGAGLDARDRLAGAAVADQLDLAELRRPSSPPARLPRSPATSR